MPDQNLLPKGVYPDRAQRPPRILIVDSNPGNAIGLWSPATRSLRDHSHYGVHYQRI
jgi:hypothetical protein